MNTCCKYTALQLIAYYFNKALFIGRIKACNGLVAPFCPNKGLGEEKAGSPLYKVVIKDTLIPGGGGDYSKKVLTISLPFHIPILVKSLLFYVPEA